MLSRLLRNDSRADAGLSDVQQRTLETLRADGVVTVSFADLVGDTALWEELEAEVTAFAEAAARTRAEERDAVKSFIVRRHDKTTRTGPLSLPPTEPLLRFGVIPELLAILDAYRGAPVWLQELDMWYTLPNPSATERVSSQQWHRDGRENHILKVFTYFSDVDDEAGPLEYVRGSAAGGKYGALFPWEKSEVYPPHEELHAAVDADDFVALTAPRGTIVICDTSGFHRGGFARSNPRVMTVHAYLSEKARKARKFEVDWSSGDGQLTASSLAALR